MYETLKGSIEILTRRMKVKKIDPTKDMSIDEALEATAGLSLEEAKWLLESVELLIEDAYKYGPPLRPARIEESSAGASESE